MCTVRAGRPSEAEIRLGMGVAPESVQRTAHPRRAALHTRRSSARSSTPPCSGYTGPRMDGHNLVTAVTCAGHLALALLIWTGGPRTPIVPPLALLFFDAFAWNFADLAYRVSGDHEWHAVDHFISTFMPVLALQVVVVFVGRARASRRRLQTAYVASFAVALVSSTPLWWKLLLAVSLAALAVSVMLLLVHRRQVSDGEERARTGLVLSAVLAGTILGSTDLWFDAVTFPMPRLSSFGTFIAMVLIALGTLRRRLLGREVPLVLVLYALLAGVLSAVGYLAAIRWLAARTSLWLLSTLTLAVVGIAVLRELGRSRSVARERTLRFASLGRFSEQLAHDIKNPLAALKGALQFLIVERAEGRSLDANSEFLDLMLDQVERLRLVIDDYQRLANVDPRPARGSVNEIVRRVLALQRFAAVPGVSVQSVLSEELPDCNLDGELVGTVLENVLCNAFEAMPAGGTVTVRTEHAPDDEMVLVIVEDTGRGMDARALERATDEFFSTKPAGTGLGLNFAARVAAAHGGTLELSSAIGTGTCVRLRLPHGIRA